MQQPISPHIANTLNITASPFGKDSAPAESVPGQKRLTVKPHTAQDIKAKTGILTNAVTK